MIRPANTTRRGMALIVTVVMTTMIAMLAIGLAAVTWDEIGLSANNRRARSARFAAEAGLTHFVALGIGPDQVGALAAGREGYEIVSSTPVDGNQYSRRGHYRVQVGFCCRPDGTRLPSNQIRVTSIGEVKRGGRVIASSAVSVTVEQFDPSSNVLDRESQGALSAEALGTQTAAAGAGISLPSLPRRQP
jgi:hypothetical protein